jgi:hypothetical protein
LRLICRVAAGEIEVGRVASLNTGTYEVLEQVEPEHPAYFRYPLMAPSPVITGLVAKGGEMSPGFTGEKTVVKPRESQR